MNRLRSIDNSSPPGPHSRLANAGCGPRAPTRRSGSAIDICTYIAKHNPPAVRARFEQLSADALAMSVITLGELQHGEEKSQARAKALAALEQLQSAIQVMP